MCILQNEKKTPKQCYVKGVKWGGEFENSQMIVLQKKFGMFWTKFIYGITIKKWMKWKKQYLDFEKKTA